MTGDLHSPIDLYNEIVKVAKPDEIGNWTSDLQCKATKAVSEIINRYEYRHMVTMFHSAIDGSIWYEVPFAFAPWWSNPYKYT